MVKHGLPNASYTAAWQKDSKLSDKNSNLKSVMDFAFFDRINRIKHEETNQWDDGFAKIYTSLGLDYLYPNPASVLAFVENHDTDRFLGDEKDATLPKTSLCAVAHNEAYTTIILWL